MISVSFKINEQAKETIRRRFAEKRRYVQRHRATVGIHEADGSQPKVDYDRKASSATLSEIAAAHEFGLGVPERSFIRAWFDANEQRLRTEVTESMRQEVAGDKGAVEKHAHKWANELRDWIVRGEGNLRLLSPQTVIEKEHHGLPAPDVPLFATAQLAAAIIAMVDGSMA